MTQRFMRFGALLLAFGYLFSGAAYASDGAIGGQVWCDVNKNGIRDAHETDACIVKVYLDKKDNPKAWFNTETNADGTYEFRDLPYGKYRLRFEALPGSPFTKPNRGADDNVDSDVNKKGATKTLKITSSNPTIFNVDAGYTKCPDKCVPVPTEANDDSVMAELNEAFSINVTDNDSPDGTVMLVSGTLPAGVTLEADGTLSGTATETGTFEITYKLSPNECSEDHATVVLVVKETPPPPPKPKRCEVEIGHLPIAGVEVHAMHPDDFAPKYNLLDAHMNLVIMVTEADSRLGIEPPDSRNPNYEIEWEGGHVGYDESRVVFVQAVGADGQVSEKRECKRPRRSPIALDMDGSGSVERIDTQVAFDFAGNGERVTVGEWFAPGDGILIDRAIPGAISGAHLFGDQAGMYADGFAKLARRDANADGFVAGAELQGLALWTDANTNAVADAGEIGALPNGVRLPTAHVGYLASAELASGSSVLMEDVWFPVVAAAAEPATKANLLGQLLAAALLALGLLATGLGARRFSRA
ncbi:MAG: SdrD B-like domain-containing protein [Pseudomonadota bacterium]